MNDWISHFNSWFGHTILQMPPLASKEGEAIDSLIVWVHYLMIALFVGWVAYFAYVLYRFNDARNKKADYEGSKSSLPKGIEIAVVLAEAVLLLGIAMPLWSKNVQEFPKPQDSTVIQVMAQQYSWNVRYPGTNGVFARQDMKLISPDNVFGIDLTDTNSAPGSFTTVNDIHVPINRPVVIYLSSKDVIHSFKVISMRVTQDAIPGLRIPLMFTPTQTGKYQIECAQLCGGGHSSMSGGFVTVDNEADYRKWLSQHNGINTGGFE
jgi:cytochrome c oxidase subunit 2